TYSQVYSGLGTVINVAVPANGSYTFRVKAIKSGYADSGYTTTTNSCIVTLACGAPSIVVVASTNSTGSVQVSWSTSDIGGATYVLEQSFNGGTYSQVYSGLGTVINVAVPANGSYTFRVKAIKSGYADSGYTTTTNSCIVTLACGAPSIVVVASTNSTGSVQVSWSTSDIGGATYVLEQSFNGGTYSQVYSGLGTVINVAVPANGSYTFRVKAIKSGYADSGYTTTTNSCIVTLACGAPSIVVVASSNSTGSVQVSLSTSDIGGATYVLEQSFNGGTYSQVYSGLGTVINVAVPANGSYTFRVKAIKSGYADSGYTTTTNSCIVTLACGAPSIVVVASTNSTGSVQVSWSTSDIGGATYVLEQSFNGGTYSQVYSGLGTVINVAVPANGSYTFRVKAIKSGYADSGYTTTTNSCIVTLACGAPSIVVVASTNSTGSVQVSWSTSDIGGATYVLEKSFNGGTYSQVYSGLGTVINVAVPANGSYTFRVKAIKSGYADSGYTTTTNSCIVTLACGAPSIVVVASTNSTGSVQVSWSTS